MKLLRIGLGPVVIFIAFVVLTVSFVFGEEKSDEQRKAAVDKCQVEYALCKTKCPPVLPNSPGAQCLADCDLNYAKCLSAARRGSHARGSHVTTHPSIAPPTPTPRKISPDRVTSPPPRKS
jgi:hypothetical protein